jgi:cysteine-rich repeat protein
MQALVGLLLGAAACNQIAGIDGGLPLEGSGGAGGSAVECSTVADCEAAVPECQTAVGCEQGACLFEGAIEGTPLAAQTLGDCLELVCDGEGASKLIPVATDAPDDGKACTLDICSGTTPVHTLLPEIACYTGPLGTNAKGICVDGAQKCDDQGNPIGVCEGEVLPKLESCEPAELDEDCDGQVNEEGGGCVCGDGYLSAGEQCDDAGKSPGDGCSAACAKEASTPVAGGYHTCAILYTGALKCWGNNDGGQLGVGDIKARGDDSNEMGSTLLAINLGLNSTVVAVAAGDRHTCAVLVGGSVRCWGNNMYGQLGLGDIQNRGDGPMEMGSVLPAVNLGMGAKATALAGGYSYTCARLDDGSVKCWGGNVSGQLGLGDTLARGDEANEMGSLLPTIDLGTGKTAAAIASGADHVCALLNDGAIKCWGENTDGRLGLGDTEDRGDNPGEMGDALPAVDLGPGLTVTAIALGYNHTCALLAGGKVKCWGINDQGQLGLGMTGGVGDDLTKMGANLPFVDLGSGKTATAITAGSQHTCASLSDGSIKCWGWNGSGQLGVGDELNRGDEPNEMGDSLPAVDLGTGKTVASITAGIVHTCAQLSDGGVKCWGDNNYGQLGLGDTEDRGELPGQMGDDLPTAKLFSATW